MKTARSTATGFYLNNRAFEELNPLKAAILPEGTTAQHLGSVYGVAIEIVELTEAVEAFRRELVLIVGELKGRKRWKVSKGRCHNKQQVIVYTLSSGWRVEQHKKFHSGNASSSRFITSHPALGEFKTSHLYFTTVISNLWHDLKERLAEPTLEFLFNPNKRISDDKLVGLAPRHEPPKPIDPNDIDDLDD